MTLSITGDDGKERELTEIGYSGLRTLRYVSIPWIILSTLGLQNRTIDFEGISYVVLYGIPPLVLLYNLFVHARSKVLSILNHHIALLTLYGILATTDLLGISLTAFLLYLTLVTRFIHKTCVFRMITHSCDGQNPVRFNKKNLQILTGAFLLVCKLIYILNVHRNLKL